MFCHTTWNGIHILPDGYIRLCSLGENTDPALDYQKARDKNGNVMHILTHSLNEIMNSDKHKEVRLLNVKNENAWSPHCGCCKDREMVTNYVRNHENRSRRLYLMQVQDSNVSETNFQLSKISDTGEVNWMPNSLDIRFGNLCNQKCVMCNPTFSNLWYEEYFDYHKTNSFGQGIKIEINKDSVTGKWIQPAELKWFENPIWWEKFEQMMPHLRHIYITGGEPMVTPAHDVMLDKLIESDYAKNIWLEYDTNASAINEKITKRWAYFNKVHIRASLDAIEDQYELIRFGGNWEKFQANVKKLKQYEIESNGKVRLLAASSCFQILTLYSIIKSEEWCKKNDIHFHIRFLRGPERMAVSSLCEESKKDLISYYSAHIKTSSKAGMIINYLKEYSAVKYHNPHAVKDFLNFMNYLDSTRNTNWKAVFPDVLQLIEKNELPYIR